MLQLHISTQAGELWQDYGDSERCLRRQQEFVTVYCIDKGYDLLIIDYLQLVDRGEGSLEEVIKAIRGLVDKLSMYSSVFTNQVILEDLFAEA